MASTHSASYSDGSADAKRRRVAVSPTKETVSERSIVERSIEQFVDHGTRLMERMLLQTALQVRMAEAQRGLYRCYVRVAQEHTLTGFVLLYPVKNREKEPLQRLRI